MKSVVVRDRVKERRKKKSSPLNMFFYKIIIGSAAIFEFATKKVKQRLSDVIISIFATICFHLSTLSVRE
jgi:hypothetical protein